MAGALTLNAVWAALVGIALQAVVSAGVKVGINWQTGFESTAGLLNKPLPGELDRYLIASFPQNFKISYARLPDPTWRPLVVKGLANPSAIAVDEINRRLFVADPTANAVYWYKLEVQLPSKFLITDGVQRLAVANVTARGLAVSQNGDLYVSGRNVAAAGVVGRDAIYKQVAQALASEQAAEKKPLRLWTAGDGNWVPVLLETGVPSLTEPMAPSTPEMFTPGPIAVDLFSIYWGNIIKRNASALARAAVTVPAPFPGAAQVPKPKIGALGLANNLQSVSGLAVTASGVFYAGQAVVGSPGVFAMTRGDALHGCAEGKDCLRRVADVSSPVSLAWDGDATLFIADKSTGSVLSVASSTIGRHELEKVADARGLSSISVLSVPASAAAHVSAFWAWLLGVTLASLYN